MKTTLLASALLLLINLVSCKCAHQQSPKTTNKVNEMPKPVMDNNIDSLKQIQQHKRDSIKQLQKN
jgi:hypothetical protein